MKNRDHDMLVVACGVIPQVNHWQSQSDNFRELRSRVLEDLRLDPKLDARIGRPDQSTLKSGGEEMLEFLSYLWNSIKLTTSGDLKSGRSSFDNSESRWKVEALKSKPEAIFWLLSEDGLSFGTSSFINPAFNFRFSVEILKICSATEGFANLSSRVGIPLPQLSSKMIRAKSGFPSVWLVDYLIENLGLEGGCGTPCMRLKEFAREAALHGESMEPKYTRFWKTNKMIDSLMETMGFSILDGARAMELIDSSREGRAELKGLISEKMADPKPEQGQRTNTVQNSSSCTFTSPISNNLGNQSDSLSNDQKNHTKMLKAKMIEVEETADLIDKGLESLFSSVERFGLDNSSLISLILVMTDNRNKDPIEKDVKRAMECFESALENEDWTKLWIPTDMMLTVGCGFKAVIMLACVHQRRGTELRIVLRAGPDEDCEWFRKKLSAEIGHMSKISIYQGPN